MKPTPRTRTMPPRHRTACALAVLLAGLLCGTAAAAPQTTWGCHIKFPQSGDDCSLKVVRGDDGVLYNLAYGENKTTRLRGLASSGTGDDERLSFDMTLYGQAFACRLNKKRRGTYAGNCDGDSESFRLRLTHPNANSLIPDTAQDNTDDAQADGDKQDKADKEKNDNKGGKNKKDKKDKKDKKQRDRNGD